ncbi:aminoglycoside 6-adenylyltransferase [Streptomyces sp. TR02-1]|uniref:aminoglycoside 6-adenylyltransferase n=1 Tax=Streptomyces sp. TR02-1 TaxID=3385977 RepID=UPI0039A03C56
MEDPEELLAAILEWAARDPRVTGVVRTGSRARGRRVDRYSDLDLELIGPRWRELSADSSWFHGFGDVMVALPFDSDGTPGADPPWPTRLVVYRGGRKVDFTVAGEERIARMLSDGLDPLYDHGFVVHYDTSGLTARLPAPRMTPPHHDAPEPGDYQRAVTEFWFEATQVPVYVARDDLWVAQSRLNTMREMLLRMLEWYTRTDPEGPADTWHSGHRVKEWLSAEHWDQVARTFPRLDAEDVRAAHGASTNLFEATSRVVAQRLGFASPEPLGSRVRAAVARTFPRGT